MKLITKALFFFFIAVLSTTVSADSTQEKLYAICNATKGAVVKVYAQKKIELKDAKGESRVLETLDVGSGFIISKDGIVMTSAYVTHGANKVWIELSGLPIAADIKGFDPLTTLSIVKIKGKFDTSNINVISMNSAGKLPDIGTMLVSLSCEMGLPMSPRLGLAAGHNIDFGGNILPAVYLRATMPAPRGATGGAVFDINGKFVGVTIASLPEMTGSFVLPARIAAKIRDDILNCGTPIYSWFGLRAEDSVSTNGTKIIVTLVAENSPAKRGGFALGDEIIAINSQKVSTNAELRDITFFVRPSERTTFKVKRGDKILNIEVVAEMMSTEIIGAAMSNLSKKIAEKKSGQKESAKNKNSTDVKNSEK